MLAYRRPAAGAAPPCPAVATRLPRQALPAYPSHALPGAPEQNGGPAGPAECRGHVMAVPAAPRELGGGGSSAARPAPSGHRLPRAAELGSCPQCGVAGPGAAAGQGSVARRPGRHVGARTSRGVTASRARCGARSEGVTQDHTEGWFIGGSNAPRLGIQNQINFPREITGVQWKPLSRHLLLWTLSKGLLGVQCCTEQGGPRDRAMSYPRRSEQKERREH